MCEIDIVNDNNFQYQSSCMFVRFFYSKGGTSYRIFCYGITHSLLRE